MRKLCLFALPFCAVIYIADWGLPFWLPICLGAAGLSVLAAALRREPVWLMCLGIACGLVWFQGYTLIFRAPAQALEGRTVSFSATVVDWPEETSTGSVGVEVRVHLEGAPDPKALLYADAAYASLRPGDTISGLARFQSAGVVRGETVTYYAAEGVFLRASAVGSLTNSRPDNPPVATWPAYVSRALKESAAALFPTDVSGLVTALLTGDKTGLSDGDYAALRRAGAAHIVAVSGLHLSFFAQSLA